MNRLLGFTSICVTLALLVGGPAAYAKKIKKPAPVVANPQDDKTALEELRLTEGDEDGNEIKSLKAEIMVRKTEEQAIAQAQKLLANNKGKPLEAEILFRLAELYMRRSKSDRFFEVHRESEKVVKLAPRVMMEASSRQSLNLAITNYADLQARFPDFAQIDLVIFNEAFAHQALAQEKEAEVLYKKLVAEHQTSFLVPDSHLALGEIAFTRAQFQPALEHFNAIRKFPESRVYPYGLYKAAWTHYNLRDNEKGLKKLEEVVAFGRFVQQTKTDARLDLRKEALNDMTLFFEDVYPAKDAYKYFLAQAGPEEVGAVLLRLANLYDRHSRFDDQRIALQAFSDELPKSPLLIKVNTDLILAMDHLKQKDQANQRMKAMTELCRADGKWVRAQSKVAEENKKLAGECLASLNDTALKLARKWLRAYKKLPSDTSFADASEKAFEIYLATPGESADRAEANYAYADLLFSRAKYRQASTQYALVSHSTQASKVTHDAGYGAVVSLEKAVGDKWSGEDEKNFHQLATEYVQKNPTGPYRLDLEYKMALLAYEKERYAEAAPIFLRLGHDFAKQDKGMKAQDLYLDILNLKKDFVGVRDYTAQLLTLDPAADRAAKLRKLHEQAFFLEVQTTEEKGQLKEAITGYLEFAKQNPTSDLGEKAIWNAMQLQFKTGDPYGGAKTAEMFADRYPKSGQSVNALMRAAQTFEQMGQLRSAAKVLEKLSARDEKSALRWQELAADFYALDGDSVAARKLYAAIKTQTSDPERRRALLVKQETFEKNYGTEETHSAVVKVLVDQGVAPIAGTARVEAVEALFKQGRATDAFNEAKHALGSAQISNDLKARLRLVQARVLEDEFQKASVKSRAERVGTVLALKTEKLTKAQEAFTSAIKFGNPRVSVESFERLYGCYHAYVKALKEMPTPTGLNDADAKAFRTELSNLVVPLEEKSVDTLAQALKFARTQPFLDGTAGRLEAELNMLNGQATPRLAPSVTKPDPVMPLLVGAN